MTEKEAFGQRLKRLIKREKLSQQDVADALNLPRNTVWRWINEQATPESSNLQKVATLLHTSVDELLNGVPEQNAWVLHVQIGDNKEEFIDMGKLAKTPVCAIITDANAGFIKLGGNYELWQDDALFKRLISDLKKLRSSVIQNGRALGGIKDEEAEK